MMGPVTPLVDCHKVVMHFTVNFCGKIHFLCLLRLATTTAKTTATERPSVELTTVVFVVFITFDTVTSSPASPTCFSAEKKEIFHGFS